MPGQYKGFLGNTGGDTGLSVYVHVPFCISKCPYCDFASVAGGQAPEKKYVECLLNELRGVVRHEGLKDKMVASVYFGGGTPTLFSPDSFSRLLGGIGRLFSVLRHAEITIEANPDTIDLKRLKAFKDAGINRLSLGIQSLDNDALKTLGRTHDAEKTIEAFLSARDAGFANIGVDLIFGVPGQGLDAWGHTLSGVLNLKPEHVSTYGLTFEKGTPFHRALTQGAFENRPQEDEEARMFLTARGMLKDSNYNHYEISNFSLSGRECLHNLRCWLGLDYVGVGVGAHSYFSGRPGWGRRCWNFRDIGQYMTGIERQGLARDAQEGLTKEESMIEAMMLGLRMPGHGINAGDFALRFGLSPEYAFREMDALCQDGLLVKNSGSILLTERGILISDEIFARLAVGLNAHAH
ncbi:MAG: radical SAM family heme chaperone HemW [Deltaproteobacteria bacterium]